MLCKGPRPGRTPPPPPPYVLPSPNDGGPARAHAPAPHTAPRPRWATLLTGGAAGEGGGARARRQRVAHSGLHLSGGWAHHPHSGGGEGGGEGCAGGVGTPRGRPPRPRQRWARRGATAGAAIATHPNLTAGGACGGACPSGPIGGHPRPGLGARCKPALPLPATRGAPWLFLRGPPTYCTYLSRRPHPRVWPPATVAARQMAKISTTPPPPPRAPTRGVMVIPAAPRLGPLARAARGSLGAALWSATPVSHAGTTRAGRAETHTRPRPRLWARWPRGADAGVCDRGSGSTPKVGLGPCGPRHPPRSPPLLPRPPTLSAATHPLPRTRTPRRAERRGGASLVAVPARAAAPTRPLPPAGPRRAPDRSVTPPPPPPP